MAKEKQGKAPIPVLAVGIMGRRKDAAIGDEDKGGEDAGGMLADIAAEIRSAKSDEAYAEALAAFVRAVQDED